MWGINSLHKGLCLRPAWELFFSSLLTVTHSAHSLKLIISGTMSCTRHSKQPKALEFIPHGSIALASNTLKFLAVLDGHVAA